LRPEAGSPEKLRAPFLLLLSLKPAPLQELHYFSFVSLIDPTMSLPSVCGFFRQFFVFFFILLWE